MFLCPSTLSGQDSLLTHNLKKTNVNKRILYTAITTESIFYIGGMAYLKNVWYKDVERVPFNFYNDNAGYNQIDKLGHAYASYLESKICYYWLRKAGVKKNTALLYGGSMGIILQMPIEIFDGIYEGWGFSWGDVIANTAGSAFLIAQEIAFDEQVVDFKFSFTRSKYADQSNGMLGDNFAESLFYDYNGHSYWLSTNINRIIKTDKLPPWLNVAVGYSANGMFGEFSNRTSWNGEPLPSVDRSRQFLVSLDVDWTAIKTDRLFLQQLFKALNHVKLPFPTLEYNTLGEWKFHYLYF